MQAWALLLGVAVCIALERSPPKGPSMDKKFDTPEPMPTRHEEAAMPYHSSEKRALDSTIEAKLMALDGVEGVGIGQDAIGNEGIVVYVRDQEVAKRVPPKIDGLNVSVQVTGPIDAL